MTSFNKNYLDALAKEKGFIRDNLEKVLRLVKILEYIHDNEHLFVEHFNRREYCPALLFGENEIADRIAMHPMALWKCRPKDELK